MNNSKEDSFKTNKFSRKNFSNNMIFRSLNILVISDRVKVILLIFIQIILSFLDLAGVAVIGMIGAMTINGSSSRPSGDRVNAVLNFIHINNLGLAKQVAILGVIAATLLIGKTISTIYLTRKTMFFLGNRASEITKELIYKILNQSHQEMQKRSLQENVYIITGGVANITNGIISAFISLTADVVLLLIMLIGLIYVDLNLAFLTIVVFGSIAIILYKSTHLRAKNLGTKQMNLSIKSIEMIQEIIGSFREAVIGGRRSFYAHEIGKSQRALARNQAELAFLPMITKYVLEVTVVIGFLLISAVTFSQNNAARSVAVISVFLAASTRIAPAILRIQQVSISIKGASSSAIPTITLIESFKSKNFLKEAVNKFTNVHTDFIPNISVNNIYFTYDGNSNETLRNINLEVKPGEVVALVGKSGSGKTTLVDIITGVLSPNVGEVTISGIKSSDVSRKFPGAISYVPQDIFISNGSIRSNICLGFEINEISDKEIWHALETAQLADVVVRLPKKLDNLIGDRGSKLSGGQRQRLGIARALITKPQVLILDEATSSLDSQTELDVSESILNLAGKVTVIIIAHRLSTVQKSNTVVYIDNGEIKSFGSFSKVRSEIPDFNFQAKLLGI